MNSIPVEVRAQTGMVDTCTSGYLHVYYGPLWWILLFLHTCAVITCKVPKFPCSIKSHQISSQIILKWAWKFGLQKAFFPTDLYVKLTHLIYCQIYLWKTHGKDRLIEKKRTEFFVHNDGMKREILYGLTAEYSPVALTGVLLSLKSLPPTVTCNTRGPWTLTVTWVVFKIRIVLTLL
jgi:hypothetical protein